MFQKDILIDLNLPFTHPEWIMAYKYAGQTTQNTALSCSATKN